MRYTWGNPRKWNLADPAERAKAANHYAKLYNKHRRRLARRRFFGEPRFALLDMIGVALVAAILSQLLIFVALHLR